MLSHTTRKALAKLLLFAVGVLLTLASTAYAAERLNLVVLVDLTQSVAVQNHDGKTELQKKLDAVARLLTQVPAGAHLTVAGITDNSFAQPYILLTANVGDDEGYFKERLAKSRQQLVLAWQKRTQHLELRFRRTDILGALFLASQMFEQSNPGSKRVLVILSDMRQDAIDLNLESGVPSKPDMVIARLRQQQLIADLRGIRVFVLGADNSGKSLSYWSHLHGFWSAYFKETGVNVGQYSTLRECTGIMQ